MDDGTLPILASVLRACLSPGWREAFDFRRVVPTRGVLPGSISGQLAFPLDFCRPAWHASSTGRRPGWPPPGRVAAWGDAPQGSRRRRRQRRSRPQRSTARAHSASGPLPTSSTSRKARCMCICAIARCRLVRLSRPLSPQTVCNARARHPQVGGERLSSHTALGEHRVEPLPPAVHALAVLRSHGHSWVLAAPVAKNVTYGD